MLDEDLERDGYVVVPDVLSDGDIDAVRAALAPEFAQGYRGRNPFEGHQTQRVYCLVAKSRAKLGIAEHAQRIGPDSAVDSRGML